MSAPKQDWIFTVILVGLIATLSAVAAIYLLPSRDAAEGEAPAAVARQDEQPGAGTGETSPAGADAEPGALTTDGPTTESAAVLSTATDAAAASPAVPRAGTETDYSPDGVAAPRPPRPIDTLRPRGTPRQVVVASAAGTEAAPFANLGRVNLFDPIVPPTPTPTPRPTPTPKANSLEKVLASWVLEYPLKNKTEWVFSVKGRPDQTNTVTIGVPYNFKDVTDFQAQVAPNGKYGVQFEYEGQVKKFSMVE